MNHLRNTGIVGSNRTGGIYVCVRLFCVWVAALRRADPPSKESCRLCKKRLRNWRRGQGLAVEPVMNEWNHYTVCRIWGSHSAGYEELLSSGIQRRVFWLVKRRSCPSAHLFKAQLHEDVWESGCIDPRIFWRRHWLEVSGRLHASAA
jgi:hypothetical protein